MPTVGFILQCHALLLSEVSTCTIPAEKRNKIAHVRLSLIINFEWPTINTMVPQHTTHPPQRRAERTDGSVFSSFILPPLSVSPVRIYRKVICILAFSACLVQSLLRFSANLSGAGRGTCTPRLMQMKYALWALQEFIVSLRGALVLALLCIFGRKFDSLKDSVHKILSSRWYPKKEKNWCRLPAISAALYAGGSILPICMDVLWWLSRYRSPVAENSDKYAVLGLQKPNWAGVVCWLLFGTLPFVLSQEILRMIFLVGVVLRRSLVALNRQIKRQTEKVADGGSVRMTQGDFQSVKSETDLDQLLVFYRELLTLVDCFGEACGMALGAALGMDILATFSMVVAGMLSAQDANGPASLTLILSIIGVFILATYVAVFTVPIMTAAFEVSSIS